VTAKSEAVVYVAAGSNVEPERHLRLALAELHKLYSPVTVSPAYRNRAVGFEGEDFVNLVVGFTTSDAPAAVRLRLQAIESLCGRPPDAPRWAPRSMDLDILLHGTLVSQEAGMVLPRPDLVRRAYMLKPLVDIAPGLFHPTLGRTMADLWQDLAAASHELVPVRLE
jgi:2-amino-4-hydroxy-6-hydroxymethyldihydropteridine diphosphokinase